MNSLRISAISSLGMRALNALFNDLKPPYGQGDVVRFNLAFLSYYPKLGGSEKARAEALADMLLNNLADDRLASSVYRALQGHSITRGSSDPLPDSARVLTAH